MTETIDTDAPAAPATGAKKKSGGLSSMLLADLKGQLDLVAQQVAKRP